MQKKRKKKAGIMFEQAPQTKIEEGPALNEVFKIRGSISRPGPSPAELEELTREPEKEQSSVVENIVKENWRKEMYEAADVSQREIDELLVRSIEEKEAELDKKYEEWGI